MSSGFGGIMIVSVRSCNNGSIKAVDGRTCQNDGGGDNGKGRLWHEHQTLLLQVH